jgi:uncharacterized protein YdcH (DUF465 family)
MDTEMLGEGAKADAHFSTGANAMVSGPDCLLMLNPREYFDLSPAKRIDYVFGLVGMKDGNDISKVIRGDIRTLKPETKPNDPEPSAEAKAAYEKAIDDMMKLVDTNWADAKGSASAFLNAVVLGFEECIKNQRQHVDRMAKTVQGMTAIKDAPEIAPRAIADIENDMARLAALSMDLAGKRATLNERKRQQEQARKSTERAAQIRRDIAVILETPADVTLATAHDEATAKLAQLEKQRDEMAKAGGQLEVAKADYETLGRALGVLEARHAEAMGVYEENKDKPECPLCGSTGVNAGHGCNLTFAQVLEDRASGLAREIALSKDAKIVAMTKFHIFDKQLNDIDVERVRVRKQLDSLKEKQAHAQRVASRLESLNAELRGIEGATTVGQPQSEASEMELAMEEGNLRTTRDALKVELAKVQSRENSLAECAKAEREHLTGQVMLAAWKQGIEVLKEQKAVAVRDAFDAILKPANLLWTAICPEPLRYHEGDIGYWRTLHSGFVSFKTFSGAERALCFMALSLGLATQAPFKLCVLDEFGNFDASNQCLLMTRIAECVARGAIDQFIGLLPGLPVVFRNCIPSDAVLIEIT